jgi:hypothetical protein
MRAQEWTRYGGTTNAPGASEEAELLELGRRVAMERGYQSVLFDDPPTTPDQASRQEARTVADQDGTPPTFAGTC